MSKALSFYNLTGGLNTVQDLATINSSSSRTESPDMMNVEYYKLGGIQTMKGNTLIGMPSPGGSTVTCGYEYTLGDESYMIVTTQDNKVWEYDKFNKTFNNIGTMLYEDGGESGTNPRHCIVGYNNGVVVVNGWSAFYYNKEKPSSTKTWIPKLSIQDEGQTLETTFHPSTIASYRGRLFMGANSVEQGKKAYTGGMLFYSGVGLGTQDVWQESSNVGEDAGAFKEFFEDSSNFTALGTWAEFLVVHKEQNTYLLNGTADLASEWELNPYSEYTTPSQQSYVVANNGYFTYVPEAGGIYSLLTRSIYNNTYQGGDLSFKIKDSFVNIDTDRYNEIYATYNPKKKYILFYMPMIDNLDEYRGTTISPNKNYGEYNGSGKCYIYDIQTKTWLFRKVPQYVTCAFQFENETYIGTKDGLVLQEFKGKTFNGRPIQFHWLSPSFIWGGGTNKTTTKEFRIKMLNTSANHFYVESYRDGNLSAKEKRLIKNLNDNLGGLIWDIDYNYPTYNSLGRITELGDWNPENFDYIASREIYLIKNKEGQRYKYTIDGTDYYTEKEIGEYSWNVPVYTMNASQQLVFDGYNQYDKYYTETQVTVNDDYNLVKQTTVTSYAWNKKIPSSLCYKYTDSNGTYYAWVEGDICQTNIVKKQVTTTNYYAFYGVDYNYNRNGKIFGVATQAYANAIKNGTTNTNIPIYIKDGSNWHHTVEIGTGTAQLFPSNIAPYGSAHGYGIAARKDGQDFAWYSYSKNQFQKLILDRAESYDDKDTETKEVPSGTNPIPNSTKTYTQSGSNIIIKINGVNRAFTRESSKDLGSVTGTNYYTNTTNVGYGDNVYTDINLTNVYGTVSSVSGNTITVKGNTLTRYSQADKQRTTSSYYLRTSKFLATTPTTETINEPIYNYPVLPKGTLPKSLTDTVWDYSNSFTTKDRDFPADLPSGYNNYNDIPVAMLGDGWLEQGYQTKRFLLPTQYFETVQFRFSGGYEDEDGDDNYSDNICISGFEVEGIQLAETPWR